MKELILKSFAYNAFIQIKDSLMAKVYALFFVKEYRRRAVTFSFVFGLSLFFLLDTFIFNGNKLSVGGALALSGLLTFALYCLVYRNRQRRILKRGRKNEKQK